jgi:hypothetical protein
VANQRIPNPGQSTHQQDQRRYKARSECGLDHKAGYGRPLVKGLPGPLHSILRRVPLVYGFLIELRSLAHRMALRCKRRYELYGLEFGPFHQVGADGVLELHTRTHACIGDIEKFVAAYPWATMVDAEMYRDAWERGATWAESNSCTAAQEIRQSALIPTFRDFELVRQPTAYQPSASQTSKPEP